MRHLIINETSCLFVLNDLEFMVQAQMIQRLVFASGSFYFLAAKSSKNCRLYSPVTHIQGLCWIL